MPSKGINQETIAKKLGIDRTAVCKILNNDPHFKPSEEVRKRVLQLAKQKGYDFSKIRRIHRRRHERKEVNLRAKVIIRLKKSNRKYEEGYCRICNIGEGGALITDLEFSCIPTEPHLYQIEIKEGKLEGMKMTGEVVRAESNGKQYFGLEYKAVDKEYLEIIEELRN